MKSVTIRCFKFKTLQDMATVQLNPYKNTTAVTATEIELVMRQEKYSKNPQ